ncbi:MAG: amidase [cyanobacterium endosymbiont of Rhopalodia musculus]|uniref:amidase n=1 Tax=cyanobacterium endosymbiont of Epithemia clementina EcSB TaxID=3034674 RepID=UPI00248155AD|nr:amidase [cyanobacterium endosymbiont of Epithemia clementina EcSB]WGT67678.1 amidase [cyanobacterium endosymbiont of Epithemia clementina EcSB]
MNSLDLAFTPALELAKLIRTRQISPLELTEVYLNRIQQYNPQLGSFFTIAGDIAMADAKAKTEQLAQTSEINALPPFFGVPTAIKDLNAVAQMPLSYGISVFKNNIVNYDDEVVKRIKEAGFIVLGKTATSQLGSFPYTEPPGFPPTRNPWHRDYVAGGSSGGAAAAVAAGLCPIAQGSDGGGSIRIPAACCGLVGIKPSRGRVSNAPVGDFQSGISTHGPLGRTVADAAALLDVMAGYVTGDPYWLVSPKISFLAATRQSSVPLKVAFATKIYPFPEAEVVIKEAVHKTVKLLAEMGHEVEPSCPNFEELTNPFKQIWQAGVLASGVPLKVLSPINQWLGEQAKMTGKYLQAVHQMQIISRQIVAFFDRFDLLVLPVYLQQPIKVGEWANLSPEEVVENIVKWIAPCPPCNASGLPGITLSMGQDKKGLPVGVQLIGKPADELTLIRVAAQLEQMTDRPSFKMIEL